MFWFYISLIILSSFFLILLCLVQYSRKENASSGIVEGSNFGKIVGVKKTKDILETLTLIFSFTIFFFSILTYRNLTTSRRVNVDVVNNVSV